MLNITVFDSDLLKELIEYCPDIGFTSLKAKKMYFLALEHGHQKLAIRIANKYKKHRQDDFVMAFQTAISSQLNNHK